MSKFFNLLILFGCLFFLTKTVRAQEDIRFSNYKYNRLFYNPAYAGSSQFMEAVFAYRNQWVDIDGSPETAILSIQAPVNNTNSGLGAVVYNNRFGIQKDNAVFLNYSYRVQVSYEGILAMGLQAGFINKQIKWTELTTFDPNFPSPNDPAFPSQDISTWVPNFGVGLYYYTPKYFVSFSAPRLLSNNQPSSEGISDNMSFDAKLVHVYLGGGAKLELSDEVNFEPSVLLFTSYDTDTNANINLDFVHTSGISLGGGYRTDNSLALLLGYQLNQKLRFSYSYEKSFGKSRSKGFTNHEIILNYNLSLKRSQITSPRYF